MMKTHNINKILSSSGASAAMARLSSLASSSGSSSFDSSESGGEDSAGGSLGSIRKQKQKYKPRKSVQKDSNDGRTAKRAKHSSSSSSATNNEDSEQTTSNQKRFGKKNRRYWSNSEIAAAYVVHQVLASRNRFPRDDVCIDRIGFCCDYMQCYQCFKFATPEQKEIAQKTKDLLYYLGKALGGRELRNAARARDYMLGKREFTFLDLAVLIETHGDRLGKYIVHLVFLILNEIYLFQAATLTKVRLRQQQMTAVLMIFQIRYKKQSISSSRKKQQGETLRLGETLFRQSPAHLIALTNVVLKGMSLMMMMMMKYRPVWDPHQMVWRCSLVRVGMRIEFL